MILSDKTIVVWFSCGAASAVAAKKTIERYEANNRIRIVNNPIKEEHHDNQRFLRDVQDWLGVEIEFALNSKYPSAACEDVWEARRFMSGAQGAPCTQELKKRARQEWEVKNDYDYIVLGFTADEQKRHERFVLTERSNVLPVLIDENITKADCYRIINEAGLRLPEIYRLGFPNANCIGCVKAGSATYWNHVRKTFPDVFKQRAEMSRRLGAKLAWYKGGRIFLDELPPDAKGRPMKNMDFECGIFCEERT
jgi:3'-phosphoadenosine 5'-phosphosulfate sulfotransferase (PAPS reductase)/FAD synthetase